MYLGNRKIRDIEETDKVTPLGSKVSKVIFMSQLELTHEAIDEAREEIRTLTLEPDSPEKEAKLVLLNKKEDEITQRQSTDTDINESMLVTQRTLDKCQTEEPDNTHYTKRKHLIVGEILQLMAEWGVQEVEIGQILQNLQDSLEQNKTKAFEAVLGRPASYLTMLDYHYAITGAN